MTRVEALVNPQVLVWARNNSGLEMETAAKKAAVKEERLASWEAGEARPTVKQLRKLARAYRRPLALFYLPEPPLDFRPMHDYRRLPGEIAGIQSPELRYEIRKAIARRDIAIELAGEVGEPISDFGLTTFATANPNDVARSIRDYLQVSLTAQSSWQPGYDTFNNWRDALQDAGVPVLQMTTVDISEVRAFSISDTPLPVVVLNTKDPPNGRCFSMMHELTHITLREGGLCDLDDHTARAPEELQTEVFCNMVAGCTLVPAESLTNEPIVSRQSGKTAWGDDDIAFLANRYGVSREVILRRLLVVGRTTEQFYRQKRQLYIRQAQQRAKEKKPGFAPPDRVALSSAGPMFTRLVLDSYNQERITASDVADFLEIRLKHLQKIENAVFGGSETES